MDSRLAQAVTKAQTVEKQFDQTLAEPDTPLGDATTLMQAYRLATDNVISCDFLYARSTDVETRLWGAHSRLNARLRKQLSKLRKERPNKPVESRKHIKLYLEFLKDSQRFYRDYIQRLNARFGGIAELQRIARQVKTEHPSLQTQVSPEVQAQVVLSCHQTLIYLGDLFRYRAAEKLDKVPDWGPAIGYYALAATLRPSSGLAFHQQSVVAFEQGDYLRSTYYLYRAIVVNEPHPNAIANLELQFKKITAGWEKGELVPKHLPKDRTASRKALVAWFIRFQSMCYKGQHFSQYEELEKEVLSRTGSELKKRTLEGVLPKMLFVSFAAQATAAMQFQSKPDRQEYMQSYFFFLRLNIKFFSTLLEAFLKDLQNLPGQDGSLSTKEILSSRLTDQARHALPCLRLYSTWLLSNAHIVSARVGDESLLQTTSRFWTVYAATLSAITAAFPFTELPEISYQLEEDVDSFAFQPLVSERTQKLWRTRDTADLKPKFSDPELCKVDTDTEMLARVRELLYDALLLAVDTTVPINFDNSKFTFEDVSQADVLPAMEDSQITQLQQVQQVQTVSTGDKAQQARPLHNLSPLNMAPQVHEAGPRQTKPNTREAQLKNMVDDLVGSEDDDDDEGLPPTPPMQSIEKAPILHTENGAQFGARSGSFAQATSPRDVPPIRTPELRTVPGIWQSSNSPIDRSSQRLQVVSSIWNDPLLHNSSPITPNAGAIAGPPRVSSNSSIHRMSGHSRGNSATSIRSSLPNQNGWSSFEPTPVTIPVNGRLDRLPSLQAGMSGSYSGMQSPLLFGAGGGPWSTGPRQSFSNPTPPNGQGG